MKLSTRILSALCLIMLLLCFIVGCGRRSTDLPSTFGDCTYTYTVDGVNVICLSTVEDDEYRLEGYYLKGLEKVEVYVILDQSGDFKVYYYDSQDYEWYSYRCTEEKLVLYNSTTHSGRDCWFARFEKNYSMTLYRADSATEEETQS